MVLRFEQLSHGVVKGQVKDLRLQPATTNSFPWRFAALYPRLDQGTRRGPPPDAHGRGGGTGAILSRAKGRAQAFDDDARHVTVCKVARIEYLVSWNFKHLANVRRESGFSAVNLLQGYPPLRIVAPTFLIHGYDQEKDL